MAELKSAVNGDFSYLDMGDFRSKYVVNDRVRFYVEGISCGKCVKKIEDLAFSLQGLTGIRVDLAAHVANAAVDPAKLQLSRLAEAIQGLGFNPIPLEPENSAEKLRQTADRRELIRLAVGGAIAGNIMTFSFANYLGAGAEFAGIFSWLSFALYLPVLFYVAVPFYKGAWGSLVRRQLSIDLPMAIASVSGFVFSFIQLLRGRDDIYFDSLSGFLFLILLSRWTQRRLQRRYLRPEELTESLKLSRVRRIAGDSWFWAPAQTASPGQQILLLEHETLPAEAEMVSASAQFSLAWLSGESRPKTFFCGSTVPAGARLLSGEVRLNIRKKLSDTAFGEILRTVENRALDGAQISNLADRWAQWLLTSVFATALIFLFAYWSVSPEEAIRRSLALLILACPCAMAFGTPLALAASLRNARRAGLILRNAGALERASKTRTVFFDKTGTLTESDLALLTNARSISSVHRQAILALENESKHPIAFAFRRSLSDGDLPVKAELWKETPGVGVSGFVGGIFYELRKSDNPGALIACTLFADGVAVLDCTFAAVLKPNAKNVLDELRAKGIRTVLLSGDSRVVTQDVGLRLGFQDADIMFECCPAVKASTVAKTENSMMVGDGINDSLAMLQAGVSVAVSGGMETALKASDVYLADPDLKGITSLIEISGGAMALIKRNLMISVFYNLTGATLALLGFINPFMAAILMPISSGFILLSTWSGEARK